jgi:hypothetical protein
MIAKIPTCNQLETEEDPDQKNSKQLTTKQTSDSRLVTKVKNYSPYFN